MKFAVFIATILLLAPTVIAGPVLKGPEEPSYWAKNTPRSVETIINEKSIEYGVSGPLMRQIIACESQYRNIQSEIPSPTGPGGREDSWGVVQIHLPDWPEVTRDMALDPEFAIDFLAKRLSEDRGYLWTCYRKSYPQ